MKLVFHKPYPVAGESELVMIPKELLRDQNKILKAKPASVEALKKMCALAMAEKIFVIVISSHRTFDEQKELFRKAEEKHGRGKGIQWVAPPGYSEHHTGYVFDLADKSRPDTDDEPSFESTAAFKWLSLNAAKFNFEFSFPKNNWQRVGYEPWHMRFVGDEESRSLFRRNGLRKWMQNSQAVINALVRSL